MLLNQDLQKFKNTIECSFLLVVSVPFILITLYLLRSFILLIYVYLL